MKETVKPKIFNIWAFKLKKNFADPWFKEKIVAHVLCVDSIYKSGGYDKIAHRKGRRNW